MVAPSFLHCEVLGPRASVEQWLASLQDLGTCYLVDALRDLEGRPGIGRPEPTLEEMKASMVRSEAATGLRAIARALPPTPARLGAERRPAWTLGPGEVGGQELGALREEARHISARLREQFEAVRAAEEAVLELDARLAGLRALESQGEGTVSGSLWFMAAGKGGLRRLRRRLSRDGLLTAAARGDRTQILLLRGSAEPTVAVRELAQDLGAAALTFPAPWLGRRVAEARTDAELLWLNVRRAESDRQAELHATVRELGPRGRFLLDSLDDAERRAQARRLLASTEHVVAARVYVRREDEAALHDGLHAAQGDSVIVRALAPADDAPTLPQRMASAPLRVLDGLRPGRFGDLSFAALLALATPLAVGWALADVAGGLFLLLAGALLGRRDASEAGAPRRDTALLAQVAGLCALLSGVLHGGALGHAGVLWFGADWGWWVGQPLGGASGALVRLLASLGWVTAVLAGYGALLTLHAGVRCHSSRVRGALAATARATSIASLCFLAAQVGPATVLCVAALVGAVLVLILEGARGLWGRLLLDLVGVVRLAAVGAATLLIFDWVSRAWAQGSWVAAVLGPFAVLIAALASVADPAHLAMGVPYDLAFGARSARQPFAPLQRQLRQLGEVN